MLFERPHTNTQAEMLDKFAVTELIEFERFCRDNTLWEQMYTCFSPDSYVKVSWYQGDGYGFVEASSKMKTRAPHKLGSTLVWLNGDKAAAVTMACIQKRSSIDGEALDLDSYTRLLYTLRREDGVWKITSMDCIYEKDCLTPAAPSGFHPPRPAVRSSYANLAGMLGMEGYAIADNLPGDDRPDLTDALYEKTSQWLEDV